MVPKRYAGLTAEQRVEKAADKLDWIYAGVDHVPLPLYHDYTVDHEGGVPIGHGYLGLVRCPETRPGVTTEVAYSRYGGMHNLIMTLHPGVLPLLAASMRVVRRRTRADIDLADAILAAEPTDWEDSA